jgi:hypothetical protein
MKIQSAKTELFITMRLYICRLLSPISPLYQPRRQVVITPLPATIAYRYIAKPKQKTAQVVPFCRCDLPLSSKYWTISVSLCFHGWSFGQTTAGIFIFLKLFLFDSLPVWNIVAYLVGEITGHVTPYTAVLSRVGVVQRVRLVEVFAVLGQDFRKHDVSLKPGR